MNCKTQTKESEDGNLYKVCECKKLSATTIVADVENLFGDS